MPFWRGLSTAGLPGLPHTAACFPCCFAPARQVISTLNEAFCDRHRKVCPPSEELERECGTVRRRAAGGWVAGRVAGGVASCLAGQEAGLAWP